MRMRLSIPSPVELHHQVYLRDYTASKLKVDKIKLEIYNKNLSILGRILNSYLYYVVVLKSFIICTEKLINKKQYL